jgi:hypothetical protein
MVGNNITTVPQNIFKTTKRNYKLPEQAGTNIYECDIHSFWSVGLLYECLEFCRDAYLSRCCVWDNSNWFYDICYGINLIPRSKLFVIVIIKKLTSSLPQNNLRISNICILH